MRIKKEWDYSSLFGGDLGEQIEREKVKIKERIEGFVSKWKGRTDYLEDVEVLREVLRELDLIKSEVGTSGDVGQYLWLRKEKDSENEEIKAKYELVKSFGEKMSNELVFFELSLGKVSVENRKRFLDDDRLKGYRHYLERVFRKSDFMLSEEVERVLTLKSGPSYGSWVDLVSGLLAKEERAVWTGEREEKKGFSEILGLLQSSDSRVGDSCFDAVNDILEKNADVAVAQLNAILKDHKVDCELRGYSRVDEGRVVSDDIDFEFVDGLVDAVSERFDISRRFYELKARLMGKERLKYYERVTNWGKVSKEFGFEEAVGIVGSAFGKMNSEFGEIFRKFIEGGNVDIYPKKGKRQGAFCSWGLRGHPIRILLNYMNQFNDVTTLAHEAGHGLNHELMKRNSSFDFGVPMAVAEVASNFAENVVFEDLISRVESDEERLALLVSKVGDDLSSIHRQVACYRFEKDLHEGFWKKGGLSKEDIGEIFGRNMRAYMGDGVEHPRESLLWWVYWWHIRDYFYVYSYASGVLIANAMVARYKEDEGFVEKVKEFLATGKSKSPRECFEDLGLKLDRDFWMKGLSGVEEMLDEAEDLARRLGKI